MRVKTRLQAMTALSASVVAIMALSLYAAHHRLAIAVEAQNLSNQIVGIIIERDILRGDYTANHNERAKEQWFSKHALVLDLLKRPLPYVDTAEEQRTISNMIMNLEGSAVIFRQIVENRERTMRGLRDVAQAREIQNRLVGQLLLKSYDTVTDARALQQASSALIESTQRSVSMFSMAFVGVLAAFIIAAAWSLSRIITKGIARLHAGAVTLGSGNLDHRIPREGKDEFAEVAAAFNSMAEKLTVSYGDLEREIAERKRTAAEVQKLNRDLSGTVLQLRQANKDLDAFSYSVSHDLRAPLRAIGSFSHIIIQDYNDKLDDEGREALGFIQSNTRNMGQLIDDLLAFARLGRQEMRTAEIDMARLAHKGFSELKDTAVDRVIEFRVGSLPFAPGDPVLLRQVFSNLLANSVKFTGPKKIAVIEVGGQVSGDEHVYWVRDNGVGFDMRYADKLFGVFQRLHSADEFEGTGVGLAIVQRIVHRHGGRVWAEGQVGGGATFYFALPACCNTGAAKSFPGDAGQRKDQPVNG